MASSALSGDRRLAFGRRGGMTVLGKVAVPKPINLPSQRLENHGLDPNVEIVPKGTLSWGNRTSTASNAWGSSTLSPRTDGGTLSPSNLSARPSSGESGTRPSTAGSDRAHDPSTAAWGSNSRPSSASGAHRSSQTSIVSLRPHSAETRPGSSQLSRFAESSPENSVGGAVQRLGMTSSRNDEFSFSSGDFPVLGSEKNGLGKSSVSQEHPSQGSGSPSSVATQGKEDNEVKNSVLNSWRREDAVFSEYGVRSGIDQWHGDSPSFPNSGMRPQHFNAWRGPIVNNHPPGSNLYRGPPGGPYGGPVVPSGFPMQPFPYYHHQAAPPVLPNPPSVPPSSTGPGGHRPNNGEFYRPLIRGAFVRPNMPVRPGFFPSPLPYDGYFGPQLRYHSPNNQDIAFAGMAPGMPSPYSRYPAPENDNLNARPSEFDSKIASSEEVELGHLHVSGGQYKVLLKQHDSWDEQGESNQQEETKATSESPLNLRSQKKTVHPENDRKLEQMQGIEKNSEIGDPKDTQKSDDRVNNTSVPWRVPESVPGHDDNVDPARRSEQKRSAPEVLQSPSATAKDSSLIQKIECLNAKSQDSDARADTLSASDWRDQDAISQRPLRPHSAVEIKSEAQVVKKNQDTRNFKPEESGQIFAVVGKIHERTVGGGAIISRSYPHGGLGRAQHYRGRVSTPNADERHKNPICMDPVAPSVETSNILPNIEVGDRSVSCPLKNEGESKPVTTDSSDSPAEHARLKELAKQRTRQRQEEEEERARDQKARALVKLEELNKRRQLEESLNLKTESSLISGTALKSEQQQGLHPPPGKAEDSTIVPSHRSISETSPVSQIDGRMSGVEGSIMLSGDTVPIRSQTSHLQQDVKSAGVIDHDPENMTSKHSHGVSKKKPNRVSGEPAKWNDRTTDVAKLGESLLDINPSTEKSHHSNPLNVVETIVHQRRKGSKTSRTKQRVDNLSPASASIMAVNEEASRASTPEENGMSGSLKPDLESSFIQQLSDSKDLKQSMEHPLAPLTETAQARFSSHGRRSQHPRRTPRNQQINNLSGKMHGSDAVMWAPRSQNKIELAVEANDVKPAEEANPSLKNDVSQKNAKHKRTEMERYIPTPVAKQMAQQGCVLQAVPRNNKSSVVEETLQVVSSVSQSVENVQSQKLVQGKESRNLDGGQNRLGGAVVSWRQRNQKESVTEGESRFAGSGKDDRIMIEDLAKESGMRYSKEKQKFQDHASGDLPDTSFNSDPNSDVDQATRDQESVARVKHSNYGVTGTDKDIKQKRGGEFSGKRHNQSSVFDQHQRVPAAVSRESHGFVDRLTTQWQPKTQKVFVDDPQGSRPSGGKWVQVEGTRVDVEEPPKADAAPDDRSPLKPRSDASATGHNAKLSSRTDHASGGRPDFNVNREKRILPQNRRLTKQQGSAPPAADEVQQKESQMHLESFENRISCYTGGNNNSCEDWNQRGHYRKQQQHPLSNRERQHPNSHYRYQTVGTEDVNKSGYFEGSTRSSSRKGVSQKNSGRDSDGVPV